ncbi:histidine kinase [Micromonospora echinofusca]|uniref:Histidine kinase n=2 Tax=Micromonospora echinofusca TaxID=47858 RepID=A0ABS3W1W2_MICEH|nr:histidine kinase [Micromonospora echinofusca]
MLVGISHAMERAALATAEDGPLAVLALFQRMPYFERERECYSRLARRAAVTVVGLVAETAPALPAGAWPVLLAADEDLAREWTVVVLTPRFGATLVAHDLAQVEAAGTLESGRLFDGWWSFRRDDALHEAVRLRDQLTDRLPATALTALDVVLTRVRELPSTPGESRGDDAFRLLAGSLERAYRTNDLLRRQVAAATAATTGTEPGLTGEPAVRRWSGAGGTTASGVLPVALVGVRVVEPGGTPERWGRRGAAREAQAVLGAVTGVLRPQDRAVRLSEQDFLLVLPALTGPEAVGLAYRVRDRLGGLVSSFPFVAYTAHCAVTVTRKRPLPMEDVRHALDWVAEQGIAVATLPAEPEPAGTAG